MFFKKLLYQLLFGLFLICLLISSIQETLLAQNKHALLIGVGDYPTNSGWQDLSAVNDIEILKNALQLQGFPEENILTLKNQEATKANITQYLREQFYKHLDSGDIAIIHFSGHGQQIGDNNGDEVDGYDEAIVPFDSPLKYEAGVYEGENLIRDEELGQLLVNIRAKLGDNGHLLVTLDACHSGTGTRGLGITRGTNQKMAAADYVIDNASLPKEENTLEKEVEVVPANLAPMVTFFSTSAGELSYEYKDEQNQSYGLLSYTFSKLLNSMQQSTYQVLIDQLKQEMSKLGALQTPQAEGILTQKIFGGQLKTTPTFFKVKQVLDANTILLEAGKLQGISEHAIIEFYAKNANIEEEPIATGVVTYASMLDADITLTQTAVEIDLLNSRGYLKNKGHAPFQLRLKVNIPDGAAKEDLLSKLAIFPSIRLRDTFSDLELITNQGYLQLINKQDKLIFQAALNTVTVNEVVQKIISYAQISYLRNLEMADKYISLEVNLINKKTGTPISEYSVGETMQLQIKNTGKKTTYYQIVDIQPDNQFAIVVPSAPYVAEDFKIEPGATQIVPIELEIYPPKGNELFKIIATNHAIDLQQSIFAQYQTKANEHNPFTNLLDMAKGKINLKGEKARISVLSKSFSIH